jgi:hypothetical protein
MHFWKYYLVMACHVVMLLFPTSKPQAYQCCPLASLQPRGMCGQHDVEHMHRNAVMVLNMYKLHDGTPCVCMYSIDAAPHSQPQHVLGTILNTNVVGVAKLQHGRLASCMLHCTCVLAATVKTLLGITICAVTSTQHPIAHSCMPRACVLLICYARPRQQDHETMRFTCCIIIDGDVPALLAVPHCRFVVRFVDSLRRSTRNVVSSRSCSTTAQLSAARDAGRKPWAATSRGHRTLVKAM